jgi:hypothetical protein
MKCAFAGPLGVNTGIVGSILCINAITAPYMREITMYANASAAHIQINSSISEDLLVAASNDLHP